jgi:hypothetical protein
LLLLGIGIAPPRHRHCSHSASALLPLNIFIPGCLVLHPSASASLLSLYQHPPFLSIGIPPSLHCPPRYRYPSHFGIVDIRRRYPSLVLGLLLPAAPQPLHPPASSHHSLSTTSITAIPTHQPTSLSKHTNIPCGTELFTAIHRAAHLVNVFKEGCSNVATPYIKHGIVEGVRKREKD